MTTVQNALQAMVQAVQEAHDAKKGKAEPVVVCISRDHGTPGDEIAHKLAERLKLTLYDREFVDKIAERFDTDKDTVKVLDEGLSGLRDLWLFRLLTGVDITPGSYRRHLVNTILSLAHVGGVVVGRGAHVVLNVGTALRVRITGSVEVCAERLMAENGYTKEEALDEIKKKNKYRAKFVWDMFHSRINEPHNFDIIINTDRLTNIDDIVETLVAATKAIQDSQKDTGKP